MVLFSPPLAGSTSSTTLSPLRVAELTCEQVTEAAAAAAAEVSVQGSQVSVARANLTASNTP
jgi:hypothetical protein